MIRQIFDKDINPHLEEVRAGHLIVFIKKICAEHKITQVKLYVFDERIKFVSTLTGNQIVIAPLTIPLSPLSPRQYIFFPRQWLESESLDQDDLHFIICHEMGHLRIKQIFLKIRHFFNDQKFHEKREIDADSFAAKVLGKEICIKTLEKIADALTDPIIRKRIIALRNI